MLLLKGQVGVFGDSATTSLTITVNPIGGMYVAPAVTPPASTNASSTLLSSLQAQLALLTSQIANHSSGSAPAVSNAYIFTSYLKPGMRSDEVLQLQKVLASLGLLSAEPNGYFGVGTSAAVKAFQKLHGLEQLGIVGPGTRAALNALGGGTTHINSSNTVSSGFKFEHFMGYGDDDAPDVTELQMRLQSLGFLSANAPLGFFGSVTETAVKKYQSAHGLPAVGYVDKATRDELNK
jgi:peptidoglycan hydrolase-like protein with peptidoglycan-binding domain